MTQSPHSFHIPVMGIAYTIDSPVKVACYGIDSVISIMEDSLIEKMREYYYRLRNETYVAIGDNEPDSRARRITDYLDLVNRIVTEKFEHLKHSAFEAGSQITKYFSMLPDQSQLKQRYLHMLHCYDHEEKAGLQASLRGAIRPGSIDVNIMTKVDNESHGKAGEIIPEGSDALSAFRGYANSSLENSSIVLSAGMNIRLFNYISQFSQFITPVGNSFAKRIILKVSDYRSARLQGMMLAKKGVWVSEFRIESGLNCGGHAFASDGMLLGPILEEFKGHHHELKEELFRVYVSAAGHTVTSIPEQRLTVQGGIGTAEENAMLHNYYKVDGTGWGTPFLLVPEVTAVDEETLRLLCEAGENDVSLSKASPLGVPFSYLKGATAGREKYRRVAEDKPGSPCTEHLLENNAEFGDGLLCTASRRYMSQKLEALKAVGLNGREYQQIYKELAEKECLCIGLCSSAILKYELEPIRGNSLGVTICPGPNIVWFNKTATLENMVDHIYGRKDLMENSSRRPHFFLKELSLYVDYYRNELSSLFESGRVSSKYLRSFRDNLLESIRYYRELFPEILKEDNRRLTAALSELEKYEHSLLKEQPLTC